MCSAIDVENMIILHLNALIPLTDEETDYEDADPSLFANNVTRLWPH